MALLVGLNVLDEERPDHRSQVITVFSDHHVSHESFRGETAVNRTIGRGRLKHGSLARAETQAGRRITRTRSWDGT